MKLPDYAKGYILSYMIGYVEGKLRKVLTRLNVFNKV